MDFLSYHKHKKMRGESPENLENKSKAVKTLDNIISVISFVFPLSTLPQIYDIWILKNVEGVSFLTWVLFLILQFPLFIYAIVHKEKRLKIMFGLWCFFYLIVIIGLLIYK